MSEDFTFTWNYRILREDGYDMLIEAHYSAGASNPTGWCYASVLAEEGGLGAELDRMNQALARPILTIADVGEPHVSTESELAELLIFQSGVSAEDWDRTPDSIKRIMLEMHNQR